MGKRGAGTQELIEEAARIFCEQGLLDYRAAKEKALSRIGLDPRTPLPSNEQVHDAVLAYQQLFGGTAYRQRLRAMRETALQAMKLLEDYEPRLVGAVASGAIHDAHHVQIHVFSDNPEALDFLFEDRGIEIDIDVRRYRTAAREHEEFPMLRFMAGPIGVDVTIFPEKFLRQAPRSPVTGRAMQRLKPAAVSALLMDERAAPDQAQT